MPDGRITVGIGNAPSLAIDIHRHSYISSYVYDFIGLVLPRMDREAVDAMMAGPSTPVVPRARKA